MNTISATEAVSDLMRLFQIGIGLSFTRDNRFYICKWEFSREEIHKILSEYFSTRILEPGWRLILDPVQYIYNEFYLTNEQ